MQDEVKKIKKKFFITGLITGVLFWLAIILFIFKTDTDYCIEDGDCKEGTSINIDSGTSIIINKQTCLENYGDWDEDKRMCFF